MTQVVHTPRTRTAVERRLPAISHAPRALLWDGRNSSSVLVARSFVQQGWAVDWLGARESPWSRMSLWSTRTYINDEGDPVLDHVFHGHPLDALMLHGDNQVRWVLRHWNTLPENLRRHLPPAESLEIGLSKQRSMQRARDLGVPVLETIVCASRADVAAAAARLGTRGEIVLKGEGSAGGAAVLALPAGKAPSADQWHTVTRQAPAVLVQRRIRGPRFLVTVVYERGKERAACVHEKVVAYPFAFGPAAFGVTRRVEILHAYTQRLFVSLLWHGIADIEFRLDPEDGRWYFMEINPRVCATLGIQDRAGMDVAGTWARICAGRGAESPPGRNYREGVRYAWSQRAIALALRRPWSVPWWGLKCLASADSDLDIVEPAQRHLALRLGLWTARHE